MILAGILIPVGWYWRNESVSRSSLQSKRRIALLDTRPVAGERLPFRVGLVHVAGSKNRHFLGDRGKTGSHRSSSGGLRANVVSQHGPQFLGHFRRTPKPVAKALHCLMKQHAQAIDGA